jgi:type I restriction enzyme M protein
MSTKPQELNKIIADLRQIIVGKVAMPTDQIEQITLFLFLKQLSKKHDDLVRIGSKELIFTGLWERYHFDVLMRHSGQELVKECREAVESLYKNPNIDTTVRKVFERSYLKILEPKVLSPFLQYLNDKFSDGLDLGDFYESLLPILGTQNELGQFRTPRHIIEFIVRVADPSIGDKIADPACGTAGFLVSAFNYLKEKYTDEKGRLKLNPGQIKKLYNETIFGWDMEPLMVKFSLANLYLHGLKVPNVSENDTLLNENLWQHNFDIIIANPPFITPKGGARRHSRFAITSNKTEVLFCEYMVHHLNFNGRMGIIVPEGIIFDASKGHQAIRKLFLDNGLWCIVSLPSQVFQPYSGIKTNIVFIDKTLKPKQILFCDIENHGFSLNTNPAPIDKNDLPHALEIIKNYHHVLQKANQMSLGEEKYYTIPIQRISENSSVNLSGSFHKEVKTKSHGNWPMVELGEVLDYEQPTKYIVSSEDYSDEYETPVLTAGKTFILGYTNEKEGIYKNDLPVIIFDDFTTATKFVDFPFKVKSSAMKILHAKKNKANIKLLFYIMQQIEFSSSTHKRYWISQYSNIKIPLPPLKIQEQIVAELKQYEKIIEGARAVTENWKPKVDIDHRWQNKKLGDLLTFIGSGVTPKGGSSVYQSNGIMLIRSQNVLWGSFDFSDVAFISNDQDEKMQRSRVKKGDVLLNITGASIGRSALYGKDTKANVNQHVCILRTKMNLLLPNYLKMLILSPYLQDQIFKKQSGVSREALNYENIKSFEIPLPSIEIQKQIVDKLEEEQNIVEANKKLIGLFQQKIDNKIKSIYES